MTPAQCRAARGLLRMTINALAGAAVVSATTVWDYEAEVGHPKPADIDAMRTALENAGVEFIDGDRPGVRMAKGGEMTPAQCRGGASPPRMVASRPRQGLGRGP